MKTILRSFLIIGSIPTTSRLRAQNINISSGLSEVQGQVDSLFTGILNLSMALCGIGAVIGLIMAAYRLYTDEHGQGWKTALSWFGILAFICIALYVVKSVFA